MKKYLILLFMAFSLFSCQNGKKNNNNDATQTTQKAKLKVAVFKGNGAGAISVIETIEALRIDNGISPSAISAAAIQAGKLSNYDALIFPGGSGSKELNNLGKRGKEIVEKFVREEGKGIVGICAGGYLLSSTKGYPNLSIASSVHIDRAHYNRGRGLVEFALSNEGEKVFPELAGKKMFAQYYDGPVLIQSDSTPGKYTEMATFVTDIHPDDFAPTGITPGKTFSLNEIVGKGKIFIIAGHPESTPGMRWMIPRMARWVCNSELVSYDKRWVRPELNDSAILFTKALRKQEKALFWKLFSQDANIQISAMDQLYALRSRPAVRWYMGMLRDSNSKVRKHAAELLLQTEYSDALPDLKEALKLEDQIDVKQSIQNTIEYLSY